VRQKNLPFLTHKFLLKGGIDAGAKTQRWIFIRQPFDPILPLTRYFAIPICSRNPAHHHLSRVLFTIEAINLYFTRDDKEKSRYCFLGSW
jgi:hypothetical protein